AAMSALAKGRQWQLALSLLVHMTTGMAACNQISVNAAISAAGDADQWLLGLALLADMPRMRMGVDVISCSASIGACIQGGHWLFAVELLMEMSDVSLITQHSGVQIAVVPTTYKTQKQQCCC
ncbi:unnamed protein product, partial [Polarella glacialis]